MKYGFVFIVLWATAALSHPHVFIDVTPKINKFSQKEIVIGMDWHFDAFTSESLLMVFDTDNNLVFGPKEIEKLKKQFTDSLKPYDFNIVLKLAGRKANFEITQFSVSVEKKRIVVYRLSVTAMGKYSDGSVPVRLSFMDPTNFTAFTLKGELTSDENIRLENVKRDKKKGCYSFVVKCGGS